MFIPQTSDLLPLHECTRHGHKPVVLRRVRPQRTVDLLVVQPIASAPQQGLHQRLGRTLRRLAQPFAPTTARVAGGRATMRQMLGLLTLLTVLVGSAAIAQPARAEDAEATDAEAAEAGVEVAVRDDRFVDARITVPVGTTVTWVHKGNNAHTISGLEDGFDSGLLSRGDTFSQTFTEPGTYEYLCRQHLLQGMRGTITVEAAEPAVK